METAQAKKNRATPAQVEFFRALFARHGVVLASSRLRRFKALTVGQASLTIEKLKEDLEASSLASYVAPSGMATGKQLAYFSKLRQRLGEPLSPGDMESTKALSTSEMQRLNGETMRRLQAHNDAHGVPLPAWRRDRGLYDVELLKEGHRAAVARQAERREHTQARIQKRQVENPRRGRVLYPGEC